MVYTDEKKKILGKNVWRRREVLGLTRKELGDKCGVRQETVSNWELGKYPPTSDNLNKLTKIFGCSKHDLHRTYNIPVLKLHDTKQVEKTKDEPVEYEFKFDSEYPSIVIKSADPIKEEPKKEIHPVTERLNRYIEDNGLTIHQLAKMSGISSGMLWRVRNDEIANPDGPAYKKVAEYLDSTVVDKNKSGGVKVGSGPEPYKCKEQPVQEPTTPVKEKGSISERLNDIYDTLFNAMAELDELKADIAKIEKVTAMLKEIQGL